MVFHQSTFDGGNLPHSPDAAAAAAGAQSSLGVDNDNHYDDQQVIEDLANLDFYIDFWPNKTSIEENVYRLCQNYTQTQLLKSSGGGGGNMSSELTGGVTFDPISCPPVSNATGLR
jgi:hypothetical protein